MADELAQGEITPDNQTPEASSTGSEAAQNPLQSDGQPDLRVPLKEERQRRQQLENQMNDPLFIYEQAKRLGLTEEEAQNATEMAAEGGKKVSQPDLLNHQLPILVQRQVEIERAKEKYPALTSDPIAGTMVTALIQGGMSPMKAADEVFSRMKAADVEKDKAKDDEKVREETRKENAQTATPGVSNPTVIEQDELLRRSRSYDKKEQDTAMIEILKRRNKAESVL